MSTVVNLGCGIVAVSLSQNSCLLRTGIDITLSYLQGVAAAVISQPGDTLLSQINKGEGGPGSATSKLIRLAKEAGFSGLFVGLGPRIVMTAGLVSGQCESLPLLAEQTISTL